MDSSELDKLLYYAAGLIDGEGYIGVVRNGLSPYGSISYLLRIQVAMTDQAPLDLLKMLFGGRVRFRGDRQGNRQDIYSWELTSREEVWRCLTLLRGKSTVKTAMIELGLLYLETFRHREKDAELREAFYSKFKVLNRRGKQ